MRNGSVRFISPSILALAAVLVALAAGCSSPADASCDTLCDGPTCSDAGGSPWSGDVDPTDEVAGDAGSDTRQGCGTCYEALSADHLAACPGPGAEAHQALATCAAGTAACAWVCSAFVDGSAVDGDCFQCLAADCIPELAACQND